MPYQLTWEPEGVYRQYVGRVPIEERTASFDAICGDPRFDALRYCITDYLGATDYEVDEMATTEIAARHIGATRTNPRIVIAAVAVDPVVIGAIEHFKALNFIRNPYRIFPTLAEARAWVGGHLRAPVR